MSQPSLTLQEIQHSVADYYRNQRLPAEKWLSIQDIEPLLREFEHRILAEEFEVAFEVLGLIDIGYLNNWGHYRLLLRLREQLVGKLSDALSCENFNSMGRVAHNLAEYNRALDYYQQSLAIAQRLKDDDLISKLYGSIGKSRFALGLYDVAMADYLEALTAARAGSHKLGIIIQQENIARLYIELGDYSNAIRRFEEALEEVDFHSTRVKKDNTKRAWLHLRSILLKDLGEAYQGLGQYARASAKFTEANDASLRTGADKRGESIHLNVIGRALLEQGFYDAARDNFEKSLIIDKEINSLSGEMHSYTGLSAVYLSIGDYQQALELAQRTLRLAYAVKSSWHLQRNQTLLAEIYLALNQIDEAYQAIVEAHRHDVPRNNHRAILVHAIVLLRLHEPSAKEKFGYAVQEAGRLLDKTPMFFAARYSRALAMYGYDLLCPTEERLNSRQGILDEFAMAYKNSPAQGIVDSVKLLLKHFQAFDADGLQHEIMRVLKL
jgi:tetratricopeptide (TPR) repeat protein